jgi:hypothetical protein
VTATISRYRRSTLEAQMRGAIIDAVALRGGRVFWLADSRGTTLEDWPDLELILPDAGIVAHVELKSQRRIVTAGQAEVMDMLASCQRFESFIVRPEPKLGETSYDALIDWLRGEA